jgi:hypothetical protein
MSDEKQIHPLLAHGKVIDHAIIPDTKPKHVCALQSVVRLRCQLPPQRINRLGNPDPHPGWQRIKGLAESLRPNLYGRRHDQLQIAAGLRAIACPAAISPRACAMA